MGAGDGFNRVRMETRELLDALGYAGSPNCLTGRELQFAPDYGHVFRRASEGAGLEAVYCLRPAGEHHGSDEVIPVSYVCKATSYEHADEIHRLVWNQNVVPFLVVLAPQGVRVYTGFERQKTGKRQHLLEADISDVASRLAALSAPSIDSGRIWDDLGERARPKQRVEWRLLGDLERLEKILVAEGLKDPSLVHTLTGKLLYLYYLRHRDILSDARLAKWDLTWTEVATREARTKSFLRVCTHLDEWLNGSVFPLTARTMTDIGADHLQRAAGVFAGDSPEGQLHLAFDAYDFSYIPIETLSVVYEQFLHSRKTAGGASVGKKRGAYYTPLPVVNFMIDRMDEVKPLRPGMRVLDPACGSGAFLVQCYRKLIEDRLRSAPAQKLRPPELRDLLVRHVFGIDVDAEACRVAELSLLLTMLDYVDPPDLTNTNFKLPNLSGNNIIEANAFDDTHEFFASAKIRGFDWVIGNPPWNEIPGDTTDPNEKPVLDWIVANRNERPTGGNQAAEAFLWRGRELANADGVVGLLVPAMTLFKSESHAFRVRFFRDSQLAYVANFSNLAEVLFAGRSRVPAAALILRPTAGEGGKVPVFSPLVANQEPTRPRTDGTRVDTWSLVVDENELRFVDRHEAASGGHLVWKLAAWGSELDRSILRRTRALPSLGDLAETAELLLAEGMQLRTQPKDDDDAAQHHPELGGKQTIDLDALARARLLFTFPPEALVSIPAEQTWVRVRGGFSSPEKVSRPPHILVNAARNWAVFTDEYILVPPRQIGIAGGSAPLLKALALYLNSHFVQYHQFFTSTQAGVKREVGTLRALREVPIPACLREPDQATIQKWAHLHDELAACDEMPPEVHDSRRSVLLAELNDTVNAALPLREPDRIRIADFVDVMLGLRDGKIEERAVRRPHEHELHAYAERLRHDLDAFIGPEAGVTHAVDVWHDERQGVIRIDLVASEFGVTVHPPAEGADVMQQVADLRTRLADQASQWRYFNRNLRLFANDRLYLFKPMQRFHWLESQATQDAAEVVGIVLHPVSAPA